MEQNDLGLSPGQNKEPSENSKGPALVLSSEDTVGF